MVGRKEETRLDKWREVLQMMEFLFHRTKRNLVKKNVCIKLYKYK